MLSSYLEIFYIRTEFHSKLWKLGRTRMNFAKCFNSKFCLLVLGPLWISLDFVVLGKFSYLPTGDNAEITLPALMAYFNTGVEPGNWHIFSTSGTDKLSIGFFGIIQELMFRLLPG